MIPFSIRFRSWLLKVWFTSFEGGVVRKAWKQKFAAEEQERIIKLLEEAQVTIAVIDDPITLEPREIKVHSKSVRTDLLIALIKGGNK